MANQGGIPAKAIASKVLSTVATAKSSSQSVSVGPDTVNTLNKSVKDLSSIVQAFSGNFGNSTKKMGDVITNSTSDSKLKSAGQAWAQAAGEVLSTVFNRATKEFGDAFNRVQKNYENNMRAITSQMQLSQKEYANLYNDTAKQLRDAGLNMSISVTEVTTKMKDILDSQGLRDVMGQSIVQQKAIQDTIMTTLVPSINTTSRGYTKIYKQFGDSFAKYQTAVAKNTEALVGMEAYEAENSFNTTIDSLGDALTSWGRQYGEDTMNQMLGNMQNVYSLASSQGIDISTLMTSIEQVIKTGVVDTKSAQVLGIGNVDALVKLLQNPEQLLTNYASFGSKFNAQAGGVATANALGFDYSVAYNADLYKTLPEMWSKTYGSGSSNLSKYDDQAAMMKMSTSLTEQQDNWHDNLAINTEIATTLTNNLPDVPQTLDDIKSITKSIVTAIYATAILNNSGKITDLLGKLGNGGKITDLLGKGGKTAELLGKVGNVAGKALPVLSIVAGGAMAVGDAVKYGKQGGLQGAAEGFYLGDSSAGLTVDEKVAKAQQGFNWKSALSNGAKWGLVSGGAGALAGGPVGAGIGAVVGGLTGFLSNAAKQWHDMKEYKEYAKSLEKLNSSLSEQQDIINNLNTLDKDSYQYKMELKELSGKTSEVLSNIINELDEKHDMYKVALENAPANDAVYEIAKQVSKGTITTEEQLEEAIVGYSKDFGADESTVREAVKTFNISKSNGKVNYKGAESFLSEYKKSAEVAAESASDKDQILEQYEIVKMQKGNVSEGEFKSQVDDLRSAVDDYNARVSSDYRIDPEELGWKETIGYRSGLWDTGPNDMLAHLHSNEMVLAKSDAQFVRENLGRGHSIRDLTNEVKANISTDAVDSSVLHSVIDAVTARIDVTNKLLSEIYTTISGTGLKEKTERTASDSVDVSSYSGGLLYEAKG